MGPDQDLLWATRPPKPTSLPQARQGGVGSPYLYGVLIPVCVQVPAIMMWSLMPMDELLAGEINLPEAIRGAALTLWGPVGVILALGLGLISMPFSVVHVLCARALGRSGASRKVLFFVGMLNPCIAWLLVVVGLRVLLGP